MENVSHSNWRKVRQPTPVFLHGEFHGQRNLVGYSLWSHRVTRLSDLAGTAADITLMAESAEKLKSLLMKVKEESEKAGLNIVIQTTKVMASCSITSWQIDGEKMETVTDFIFLDSKITADGDCSHDIKKCSLEERL